MLRINLLHDDKEQTVASAPHSALIVLAGLLVLVLCAGIGLFGWLTLQNEYDHVHQELREAHLDLERLSSRRGPADYAGLVALERETLLLNALAQHQSRNPRALKAILEGLRLNDRRGKSILIDSLAFDGHILTATGSARSMNTLSRMLAVLGEEDALQDARFTSLSAAAEPLSGRARKNALNAIDFTFYAAIAAPPMDVQD